MRTAAVAVLVLAAGACRGYRSPGHSDPVREEIADDNVASRVRIALGRDPATSSLAGIRVSCRDGAVVLEGEVDRPADRDRVEDVAAGCEGVRSVRNRVSVRSAPSGR